MDLHRDGRLIEELSLNHWQPLSTLHYDGWVLRFADGYTKRANSISPMYSSTGDIQEKIRFCEQIYSSHRLPTAFKITPFVQPPELDQILADMGYTLFEVTSVQAMDLSNVAEPSHSTVRIEERLTTHWLEHCCQLKELQEPNRQLLERMLSNIKTRTGFISLYDGKRVVACGMGVIERGYIGLYNIVTDQQARNRGFGEQLVLNLLQWGKQNGARYSYLAVVANNHPALRLYEKVGFAEVYQYWYRMKGAL